MNTIYVRMLKRAEHTVFCVADGQKYFWDPQFNRPLPYSSGQQVKRSFIDSLLETLNELPSPTTFHSKTKKKGNKLEFDGEGEVYGTCNPMNTDQLIGGWMRAKSGGKDRTIKRRSPLSISAMTPLHPLLSGTYEEKASFDRRERPNNIIVVKGPDGNELTKEQIIDFLENRESQASLTSKFLKPQRRAAGLFTVDFAIDLRRLFCVSLNIFEPEITQETEDLLRKNDWKEVKTAFGECLLAPLEMRKKLAPAIASAIIDWKITSNQSRTFSLMETLAVSISDDANKVASSIRTKLVDEEKAMPIVDEDIKGAETFVTLPAAGFLITTSESSEALENAAKELTKRISAFDFENQFAEKVV